MLAIGLQLLLFIQATTRWLALRRCWRRLEVPADEAAADTASQHTARLGRWLRGDTQSILR